MCIRDSVSMLTIIFILPSLLIIFSGLMEKTSYDWLQNKPKKAKGKTA